MIRTLTKKKNMIKTASNPGEEVNGPDTAVSCFHCGTGRDGFVVGMHINLDFVLCGPTTELLLKHIHSPRLGTSSHKNIDISPNFLYEY